MFPRPTVTRRRCIFPRRTMVGMRLWGWRDTPHRILAVKHIVAPIVMRSPVTSAARALAIEPAHAHELVALWLRGWMLSDTGPHQRSANLIARAAAVLVVVERLRAAPVRDRRRKEA